MEKLLYEPKNSLIKQSIHATELEEPLNGDGFGVGWYNHIFSGIPGVFASITPAWNNRNLKSLAPLIKSTCFAAHVRAASVGELTETNCHPFAYKQFLMMHNGDAPEFPIIKRSIRNMLSDEMYNWLRGQTDSEHLFALFADILKEKTKSQPVTAELMADSLEEMTVRLHELLHSFRIEDSAYLNMVVMDGERMVGMRFISDPSVEPLSLYYSEGSKYECEDGICHMLPAEGDNRSVMIVSEKLTDFAVDWKAIPPNHLAMVYKDLNVKLRPVVV